MKTNIPQDLKDLAAKLLADLEQIEENELAPFSKIYWKEKYTAFWRACSELRRAIGDGWSAEAAEDIAALYDNLAGFVYGSAVCYYSNEDGNCNTWADATELVIDCETMNHRVDETAGSYLAEFIAGHLAPGQFSDSEGEHTSDRDWLYLRK
jgi:hypothetical protein